MTEAFDLQAMTNELIGEMTPLPSKVLDIDNNHLLKLRFKIYEDVSTELIKQFECLSEEYQQIPQFDIDSNHNTIDLTLEVFRKLWLALGSLKEAHILYIPPIYQNSAPVNKILKKMILQIRCRENNVTFFDACHPIIGGVEGTGKTTLMKALAIAVAICSKSYFLAYIDCCKLKKYSNAVLDPYDVIAEIILRIRSNIYAGSFGDGSFSDAVKRFRTASLTLEQLISQLCKKYNFYMGIIVDEVQDLFISNAPSGDATVCALYQYQDFARKHVNALLVLTGSSADIRNLLFGKLDRNPVYQNYPNFNRTLMTFYPVGAVRDRGELAEYLKCRYPQKMAQYDSPSSAAAVAYVAEVLHYTGGIGRGINTYVRQKETPGLKSIAGITHKTEFFMFLSILRLHQESEAGTWSAKDALAPSELPYPGGHLTPDMVSISQHKAITSMRAEYSIKDPHKLFDAWVDYGYVYVHETATGTSVQLARPSDVAIHFQVRTSADDARRVLFVHTMVTQPRFSLNAGVVLEDLVFPRIAPLLSWPHSYCGDCVDIIGETSKPLIARRRGSSPLITLCSENIESFCGIAFKWNGELGVDGLHLRVDTENKVVSLDLWQSKGGYENNSIGGGDLKTHRKLNRTSKDVTDHLASFVARAEHGAMTLAQAILHSLADSWTVKIGSFHLTTTKNASLAHQTLEGWRCTQKIPEEWAAAIIKDIAVRDRFILAPYSIQLSSGVRWLTDLLEPDLAAIWPAAPIANPITTEVVNPLVED